MSQEHSLYASNHGHIAAFETTDREASLDVATRLHNHLEGQDTPGVREHYEQHIDNPRDRALSYTRPNVGNFAVSVTRARSYEIEGLQPTASPIYLLKAETRNSAREVPSVNGPQKLQDALVASTKELIK